MPEQNFVLVGMAGLMSGVMQAPMTAIFLIADMTGGYELLIPLILTSTVSYAVTRAIEPYSIYTKRIAKKGELLTHDSDQAVLTLLKTGDLVESDFSTISIDATLRDLADTVSTFLCRSGHRPSMLRRKSNLYPRHQVLPYRHRYSREAFAPKKR